MNKNKTPLKLGIGVIPSKNEIVQIYELAKKLNSILNLSFYLKPEISLPHVTLFQGTFKNDNAVVEAMNSIDFSIITPSQTVSHLSRWAEKIIFLDCLKTDQLQAIHEKIFSTVFPLCSTQSADPQNFRGITSGQRKSFNETGYPFSLSEYLPHFTIAHLKTPKIEYDYELANLSLEFKFPKTIIFDKIVIYQVGEFGRCQHLIFEHTLKHAQD